MITLKCLSTLSDLPGLNPSCPHVHPPLFRRYRLRSAHTQGRRDDTGAGNGGPIPSNGLIVIARVKPGREERLRQALNRIGNDVKGKRLAPGSGEPHIDFPSSRTVHFARLSLLDDPDCGPGRKRLLLVTDYDGRWRDHVEELISITTARDAIWGCLEGYTGPYSFHHFIRRHMLEPQAYYISFPGLTVEHIRSRSRRRMQSNAPPPPAPHPSLTASGMRLVADLARLPPLGFDVLGAMLRRGPIRTLLAARRVNATIDRVPWIWLFNLLTLNTIPVAADQYSSAPVDTFAGCAPAADHDEVMSGSAWEGVPSEDLVSQNQLTLVTQVQPEKLQQMRAVLEVIDLYARHLAEQGSLVGISTIHTVRWALIDRGKRLLMASNYDGTWENYIDEFAEMILSGLDALWDSSYGFPELGAQDVSALKHFLRCHQAPANVFYSAYPAATVQNILSAIKDPPERSPQP
jgi:hypothetical protein